MNTYLLAWNPLKYPWGSLEDELEAVRQDGSPWVRWSVGNSGRIQPGDRLFLIRLRQEPRGIVGSGWAKSAPYQAPHWDPTRAASGAMANYIDLAFDALYEQPRLPMQALSLAPLNDYHWSTQMSGVGIPAEIATELEEAWANAIGNRGIGFPDEMDSPGEFPEGAANRVFVNRYERNPAAREACIRHYGRACSVCGMSFDERYGSIAASFIQVHHLRPLSDIGEGYAVDPIVDLRPVCPNCHAVAHMKRPPLTIDQVKELFTAGAAGI